jgi:hypothetical protein
MYLGTRRLLLGLCCALALAAGCAAEDPGEPSSQMDGGQDSSSGAADKGKGETPLDDVTAGDTSKPGEEPGDSESADAVQSTDAAQDSKPDTPGPPEKDPNFAVAANGWYRGDLHAHSVHSDGEDDVATVLAIADAYRDPALLEQHPELAGNGLDFFTITDHRTVAQNGDPDFHHDHLILLRGEEYGGSAHANIFGLTEHIPHQPGPGQTGNERQVEAIAEAHAQGAFFSVNHPVQGINWIFDTQAIDAIEVWNGPWAAFGRGTSIEELDADVARGGFENPFIRDAATNSGGDANEMGLRFWYGHLTAGIHIPLVGGSDRHLVLPIGVPTTYVRKTDDAAFDGLDGKALGEDGILHSFRAGGTFISRSPWGPQVDLQAKSAGGKTFPLGAELPGPGSYEITATVSRAEGGMLRLVAGPLRSAEEGAAAPEPTVLVEQPISSGWHKATFQWEVPDEGGWLHAIVLEEIAPVPLPIEVEQAMEAIKDVKGEAAGEWMADLAPSLLPLVDDGLMARPGGCDPSKWDPWRFWCMPADTKRLATFYMPDSLNRLLQSWRENDAPTDWCMGALTSAFMARPR